MNLIKFLIENSRAIIVFAILTGAISGASSVGIIAIINTTITEIDAVTNTYIQLFVGLLLLRVLSNLISRYLLVFLSQKAILDLRLYLSKQILTSPLANLEKIGTHRLFATLTDDIHSISTALMLVPSLFINITMLVGGLIYLWWLSQIAFAGIFIFIAIGIIGYQIPVNRAMKYLKTARETEDSLFDCFRAITQGTKELKLNQKRRDYFIKNKLHTTAFQYKKDNIKALNIFNLADNWGELLLYTLLGLILFLLPVIGGIDKSVIPGFILTVLFLTSPLEGIVASIPSISTANVSLNKIQNLGFSKETQHLTKQTINDIQTQNNTIELKGVSYAYQTDSEDRSFAIGPINFTFNPGELVFLVGGNGSGKSTFAKLLSGLYTPDQGSIELNGKEINAQNHEEFLHYFSVIFADFYLFESLIGIPLDNLKINQYLKKLKLDTKININDGVFSTIELSQGQRKRLALLTAYMEDRPVYIFDEWAAEQDPIFKDIFYTELLPELKNRGKSVLIISHDDRYFYIADRIVKLEDGKLISEENMNVDINSKSKDDIFDTPVLE